ncbi:hypothetical protein [Cytophaga aurantiaca]|uniref:hypothetical protein n=1 Tax=Cytophaga aurantiaca TaxID=29530 RepID=UPI00036503FE|nr:hypothetical protein [Cytophaga aurantiaca]
MIKNIFFIVFFTININYSYSQNSIHKGTVKKAGDYYVELLKGDGILNFYVTSALSDSIDIKTLKGEVDLKYDQQETKESFDLKNVTSFSISMKKSYFKSGELLIIINDNKYLVKFKRSDIIDIEKNQYKSSKPSYTQPSPSHQGHTH